MTTDGVRLRVFAPRGQTGGEVVTVFGEAEGDLAARARAAGTPLSVFIAACEGGDVTLHALSARGVPPSSDSGHLAALHLLSEAGRLSDWANVRTSAHDEGISAQFCGGLWLLAQGRPQAEAYRLSAGAMALACNWGIQPDAAQVAHGTLLLPVQSLSALQDFVPDAPLLGELGRQTGCAGLVLYALAAPAHPALRRADVSLRAFDLTDGSEEVVSSPKCAQLVAGLGTRGLWPSESNVLRAAQLAPAQPALLTAQFSEVGEVVWTGGRAEPCPSEASEVNLSC